MIVPLASISPSSVHYMLHSGAIELLLNGGTLIVMICETEIGRLSA